MKFYDEVNNLTFTVLNDFMGNVQFEDGSYAPIKSVFPQVKSVNHHSGYVVMKDGTIRCSLGCNMYVAQFDGCHETSVSIH